MPGSRDLKLPDAVVITAWNLNIDVGGSQEILGRAPTPLRDEVGQKESSIPTEFLPTPVVNFNEVAISALGGIRLRARQLRSQRRRP